jgi:hypothetical protein
MVLRTTVVDEVASLVQRLAFRVSTVGMHVKNLSATKPYMLVPLNSTFFIIFFNIAPTKRFCPAHYILQIKVPMAGVTYAKMLQLLGISR